MEVVDDLGEDSSPVDGVDSAKVQCLVGLIVGEESLDNILEGAVGKFLFHLDDTSALGFRDGLTWQSSKVPVTERLWTFSSRTVVI